MFYIDTFNFNNYDVLPYRDQVFLAWDSVDCNYFIEYNQTIERTQKNILIYDSIFIFFKSFIVIAIPKAHLKEEVIYLYSVRCIFSKNSGGIIFDEDMSKLGNNTAALKSYTVNPIERCLNHINIFAEFIKKNNIIFNQYIEAPITHTTATVIEFAENKHFGQYLLNVLPSLSYIMNFTKKLIVFKHSILDLSSIFDITYKNLKTNNDWIEYIYFSCVNNISHIIQIKGVSPIKPDICKKLQIQHKKIQHLNLNETRILIDLKIDWRCAINQIDWVNLIIEESLNVHKNCVFYIGGFIQYLKVDKPLEIEPTFLTLFEDIKKCNPGIKFVNIIGYRINSFIEIGSEIDFYFTTIGSLHHAADAFCQCVGFVIGTFDKIWENHIKTFPMYTLPDSCYDIPQENWVSNSLSERLLEVTRGRVLKHNRKDINFYIKINESRPYVNTYLSVKNKPLLHVPIF